MICSNKRKRIDNFPQIVSTRTCLRAAQEAGYVLGNIETKNATTPWAK